MDIELLLTHLDDGRPTLEEGLSYDSLHKAERPEDEFGIVEFPFTGGDPNSLPHQRWGVLVPEGEAGKRLLEIIAPLIAERARQQGGDVHVFRAPPGLGPEEASKWRSEVYLSGDIDYDELPRYLMILGDADQISWDMQQRLGADIFAGRLCFPKDEDYEAYVHKLLAYERAARLPTPRALFHTVRDGTAATSVGHTGLMVPTLETSRTGRDKGIFPTREIVEIGEDGGASIDDFLAAAASSDPSLLFSISHGCGAPRNGWTSPEEQRRLQGAMSFGGGARMTAEDVASRAFLPGGAWFYFACFGAGTPSTSAYHHWLANLRDLGLFGKNIDSVLKSLPSPGERPFVAALPQAALANPKGPLAVMGHVDLAWTFSFQDVGTTNKYKPARFQDVFRTIVQGKRVGAGYYELQRYFNNANADLTVMFDQDARIMARGGAVEEDKARKVRKAATWMLRQDLSAYVLLGDPAASLSVGNAHEVADPKAAPKDERATELHTAAVEAPRKLDHARVEAAVVQTLGPDALDAAAASLEMTRADLDRWIETYKAAGRKAVADLG